MNTYAYYITSAGSTWSTLTGSFTAWSNPSNAAGNDAASATCLIPLSSNSNELHGQSFFGITTSTATYPQKGISLPALATIDGIQVTINRSASLTNSIKDFSVYLTKNNGSGTAVNVGTSRAQTLAWGTVLATATYGGPSDLWGTTWTGADVSDARFGVSIAAQNYNPTGGVTASIQYVDITVYWHMKSADVKKRYQCKVYSRAGTYLGQLPAQSSVFALNQDINSAGGMISVVCPLTIDTASLQSAGSLQDETGVDLQDEAGNSLLTEGATPVVSVGTGSGLIRNGNKLIINETSFWYPGGRTLFRGTIENWQASIGRDDTVVVTAYSDGSELDNYMIKDYGTGATTVTYTSYDPSANMLETFMDDYHAAGGLITYDLTTVDATGLVLTYTMKGNTVLEGINAMLALSPNGFYWYVEIGSNTLYFKNASTTPDVYLTKGRHIETFDLTASIENVVNYELFSGGEVTPGVNFYKAYSDSGSQSLYGIRLNRRSDNRVTVTATADAIGGSEVAELKDEKFETTVTLSDSTIDTAALHVGQIIGFRGFGTFVDSLQMQIVRIEYTPDQTTLTLGQLPKRMSIHTERIRRELTALQSIDNPSTPS